MVDEEVPSGAVIGQHFRTRSHVRSQCRRPLPVPAGSGYSRSPWNPSNMMTWWRWWGRIPAGLRRSLRTQKGEGGEVAARDRGRSGLRSAPSPLYIGQGTARVAWDPPPIPRAGTREGETPPEFPPLDLGFPLIPWGVGRLGP
jgi:hypothetical protein